MDNISVTYPTSLLQPAQGMAPENHPVAGQENRQALRETTLLHGRLGYGGEHPGLVSCDILDVSKTGVRVETFIHLDHLPDSFSVEICGMYNRARLCWATGNQMGLEFIVDDMQYLDTE